MSEDPLKLDLKEDSLAGFKNVFRLLLLTIITVIIAQNAFWYSDAIWNIRWIGWIIGIALIGLFLWIWGKNLFLILDTPYFAISSLLIIAGGTALGTFVSQNSVPEAFTQRYGETVSQLLRFLHLHDVFHSWWYVALFILLIISLLKISMSRKFNRAQLGFHLAHLGPIIVLVGFWMDYYSGYRGLIQLIKGKETNHVWVYHRNTNRVKDSLKLDFNLRLDNFASEKFPPDHRIQIWRTNAANPNPSALISSDAEIITTLPLVIDKPWKIYKTDTEITLNEFYPNFYFEYSYPENKDTVPPLNPGILVEIITPHGSDIMKLDENPTGRNQASDPILQTTFEFYWILPENVKSNLQSPSSNPSWAAKTRIIFEGESKKIHEIFQGIVTTKDLVSETPFDIPAKRKSQYSIVHLYPDVNYLFSGPATRNELQENPVARIGITQNSVSEATDAFIYPHKGGGAGHHLIAGTNYFLALESIKDRETKFWRSDLSLLDPNGTTLKSESIKVNEPLLFKGYRFYQTDYDPNNPNYSGVGVSYSPGLYIVYFGFILLVAGVIILFYLRSHPKLIENPEDHA